MRLKYKCKECGTSIGFEGLCWKCRAKQHRKEVNNWSVEEIEEKKNQVINRIKSLGYEKFYSTDEFDLFSDLMTRGIDCKEIAKAACEYELYYPSALYYKADEKVRDILIVRIMATESSDDASCILGCLAMIGDEKSKNALHELKINPKPWRKNLYVDTDVYAEEGGWTFNEENEYIKLNYDRCFSFEPGDKKDENGTFIARKRGEKCKHCGCELVDILIIDGRDKRFEFLGMDGIITASCCPNCIFLSEGQSNKFTLDGKSEILEYEGIEENYYTEEMIEDMVSNKLVLSEIERPLFYGAFNCDVNTIGGFASWVQDWEYRECPECGKKMRYLAQIHWDTIEDFAEGTLYIEICTDCKVITMFHQQT
ncbi:hypothetical protein [Peptacetobacter sp. AB845]|uniref:hypothetical protein n=1 Tax=Peptacetobacter sp. AB845 TaxID=3388429 RepID=UPI0039C93770